VKNLETKVIAAAAGSGLAAALSAFLLWLVGVLAFGASSGADQVPKALAAVPEPVGGLLAILVAIGGAFIGGYAAPHTHRPDLAPPTVAIPPGVTLEQAAAWPSGTLNPGGVVSSGTPVIVGELPAIPPTS
jgi:hypothetical protein